MLWPRVPSRVARVFGGLALAATVAMPSAPVASVEAASAYRLDLYRPGVYTMQATWSWCTAASVQIMRNIARGEFDHSAARQGTYFSYMHARDRYTFPAAEGVDPVGFQAGLRRYVDPRYTLVVSSTFDNAVRSAAKRMRASRLPVALIVDRGRHAWVLTGFTASADPSVAANFSVTSVRIVGPLYGRQSKNGYDPPPNTSLTVSALRRYLNGYDFKFGPTPWDDRYVTFQVV
jgi:hypothetical protein